MLTIVDPRNPRRLISLWQRVCAVLVVCFGGAAWLFVVAQPLRSAQAVLLSCGLMSVLGALSNGAVRSDLERQFGRRTESSD
jgi:hypothetical protein